MRRGKLRARTITTGSNERLCATRGQPGPRCKIAADGAASGGQGMNESRDEWAVESRFWGWKDGSLWNSMDE
jgi:hypothetical protein